MKSHPARFGDMYFSVKAADSSTYTLSLVYSTERIRASPQTRELPLNSAPILPLSSLGGGALIDDEVVMIREHFPYAVVAMLAAAAAAGRFDLAILTIALTVLLLPMVFSNDSDFRSEDPYDPFDDRSDPRF